MNKIAEKFAITFSVLFLISVVFADTPKKGRTPSSIHNKSHQSNQSGFQESYSGQNDITQANASDLSARSSRPSLPFIQNENVIRRARENQTIGSTTVENSTTRISNDFQGNYNRDVLTNGVGPQIASAENGDLYCVVSYDASGDGYLDIVLFKSTDYGATWAQVLYAWNAAADLTEADVEVLNNYFVFMYSNNGVMKVVWAHMTNWPNGDYAFLTLNVDTGWENTGYWGSITTDKFYYEVQYTWTYVVWGAYNSSTQESRIYYSVSEDSAHTWSDAVTVTDEYWTYFRPGLAIAYSTPEPITNVDHIWTTWCDVDGNTRVASIDVYTDAVEVQTVMTATDDYDFFQAPSIAAFYDEILVMSGVVWDTSYGFGTDMDIASTFSVDDGDTWGADYDWYYWPDTDDYPDSWDYSAAPSYSLEGVIGYSMAKGYSGQTDDVLFLSNNTGDVLNGWSSPTVVQEGLDNVSMTGSAIVNNIFNLVYDDETNAVVYYYSAELGTIESGTLTGMITNAVDGTPIQNALVTIADLSTLTNSAGNYTIEEVPPGYIQAAFSALPTTGNAPLSVQFTDQSTTGNQLVTVTKDGYIDYSNNNVEIIDDQTSVLNISLSPDLGSAVMRFVLNWGNTPLDLDVHLVTPSIGNQSYHVYWAATGDSDSPPYAMLDYDVTTGYGPETMTIYDFYSGTYTFYIYNYSQSPDLSTSNGSVQIYGESGYITTVAVPTNDSGLYWSVCTVDGSTGQVAIINDLVGSAPALGPPGDYDLLKSSPRNLTWSWDFGDNKTSSEQNPDHVYMAAGNYEVTLSVSDGSNFSTYTRQDYISVTIITNSPPTVENPIDDVSITVGGDFTVDLESASVFSDADGDDLSYSASSSSTSTASVSISGDVLIVTGVTIGSATITVNADDGNGGTGSDYFTVSVDAVSIDSEQIPLQFALHQNYPNPFNPVTTLRYELPENGLVTITIYDMLGKQQKTLINQTQDAGYKSIIWDATNDYGKPVSAGIYLYQIQAGEFVQTKKMVLLK